MKKKLLSLAVLIAMLWGCTEVRDSVGNDNQNTTPAKEVTTYTLTFNSNDGTNKKYTQIFVSGESQYLNMNCFVRNGYTFAGWNTKSNGYGISYRDQQSLMLTSDMTLYAQWNYIGNEDEPEPDNPVQTYTVTFYSNDGTDKSYTQTFISGESQYLNINCFARNGYTFAGWNTSAGGYGTSYTDKKLITIYSDKTLYAQWNYVGGGETTDPAVQTYTVTFYSNDGTDRSYTQTLISGQAQYLNMNCFVRNGYTFAGWNTSAYGYETSYDNTELLTSPTEDLNLYAQWAVNTYTVKYDANGGSGEMYNQTFTYDVIGQLSANTFSRTDYKFVGWSMIPDGNITYTNEMNVVNLSTEADGEITLYAVWTENIYTVKYDANGGNGEMYNQTFTYDVAGRLSANTFSRTGYTFAGWSISRYGSAVYMDTEEVLNIAAKDKLTITLYAVWEVNESGLSITLPSSDDAVINLKQIVSGDKVMFSAKTGFDNYVWYIDGVRQSETTATYIIDTSTMNPANYKIMVVVSDGGEYYCATADLEVKKLKEAENEKSN